MSVKYLRDTPKNTPHIGHIQIKKTALESKQSVVSLSSTTAASRSPISWIVVILFPRKRIKN